MCNNEDLKIVHIAPDEKFINFASDFFEEIFPLKNEVYVIRRKDSELQYVKKTDNIKVVTINELTRIAKNESQNWTIVFFHSLVIDQLPIIQSIGSNCRVLWFCFGVEVYNDPSLYPTEKLYFKETYNVFLKKESLPLATKIKFNRHFRKMYRILKPNLFLTDEERIFAKLAIKKRVISRVNYLVSSFKEESNSLKMLLKMPALKPFEFWYSTVERSDVSYNKIEKSQKTIVLIGNSATPICNHLDVMSKIKELELNSQDYKYILPLSYGTGGDEYITYIKEKIRLNDYNIEYLEDFMPLDKYEDILATCQIAIIASRRQHAVSNAIILLARGAKLFLSVDNPFYHYLKRVGIHVYSFEKDLTAKFFTPLDEKKIENNKNILYSQHNREILLNRVKEQILDII